MENSCDVPGRWEAGSLSASGAAPFQRRSFVNRDTGWPIGVAANGLDKSLHGTHPDLRAEIVATLPELIRRAVLVESRAGRKAYDSVRLVHRFYAPFRRDDRLSRLKLTVREGAEGRRRHYSVEIVEIAEPGVLTGLAIAAEASPPGAGSPHPSPRRSSIDLRSLLSGINYDDGSEPRWTGGALYRREHPGRLDAEPGAEGVDQAIVPGAGKRALGERASWCRPATASWLAPGLVAAAGLDGLRERHRTGGIRISGRGH